MPEVEKRWRRQPVTLPPDGQVRAPRRTLRAARSRRRLGIRPARPARRAGDRRRGSAPPARLQGEFHGRAVTRHSLKLQGEALRLDDLWPLALAVAPRAADRWLGLAPQGEIRRLTLELDRPRAGAIPVFEVDADVANLGAAASGGWPGLEGLTATVNGSDERGRIELRSPSLDFEWPRMFSAAPGPIAVTGEVEWRREGRTWIAAAEKRLARARSGSRARRVRVPVRGPDGSRPNCAWTGP